VCKLWHKVIRNSPDNAIVLGLKPLTPAVDTVTKEGYWPGAKDGQRVYQVPELLPPGPLGEPVLVDFTAHDYWAAAHACAGNGSFLLNPVFCARYGSSMIEQGGEYSPTKLSWTIDLTTNTVPRQLRKQHPIFESMRITQPPLNELRIGLALGPRIVYDRTGRS
jgi:hypothetical protein